MRRLLRQLAAFVIAVQFLVPAGYMPGSLAAGTPFVLCSMFTGNADHDTTSHADAMQGDMPNMAAAAGQRAAEAATDTANETAHSNHSNAEAWEHCPLGALGAGAALAFAIDTSLPALAADEVATHYAIAQGSITAITQRARAPPALT